MPCLSDQDARLLSAFLWLSSTRTGTSTPLGGYLPNPLQATELLAYNSVHLVCDDLRFLDAIRFLDGIYMEEAIERLNKKA